MTEIRSQPDEELEIEVDVDVDPVCGELVDPDDAKVRSLAIEYEGRRYVFCGRGCRGRFEHAPTRYAAAGRASP